VRTRKRWSSQTEQSHPRSSGCLGRLLGSDAAMTDQHRASFLVIRLPAPSERRLMTLKWAATEASGLDVATPSGAQ
jgi:hypothetical protein